MIEASSPLLPPGNALYMTTVVISGNAAMKEIQLRDAKASLSAVIDEAMQGKPAVITRHGKRQAVVVSYDEWERLSHVPSFGRLLMAAPLAADDLPRRNRSRLRKANF
jgi:antitoxin Phd